MPSSQISSRPDLFHFDIPSIPLAEFDLGGVLYHSRYFALYEQTREAYLRSIDLPYPALVEAGQHLAVVESHQSFEHPVRYGDAVGVVMSSREVRRSSFVFDYEINLATTNKRIHRAYTRHAFVALAEGSFRPAALPEKLRQALLLIRSDTTSVPLHSTGGGE